MNRLRSLRRQLFDIRPGEHARLWWMFFYLLFVQALAIHLPNGLLADALGMDSFDDYLFDPIRMVLGGWE